MASASPQATARITVRPFDAAVALNRFGCGRPVIDRWLKNKAKKSCARHEHRVFLAFIENEPFPVAFYALQLGSESIDELEEKPKNYLQNYEAFPALHLSYLGVAEQYQGRGIGRFLLGDIFEKVYAISEIAGMYALTLRSLDAESTRFYEKIGFKRYSTDPKSPKMLLSVQTIRDLVEGG